MEARSLKNVGAVVASATLVAGLVGAASLPGRSSVDSGDIRKNAVKASEIASNAARLPVSWAADGR